MLRASLVTSAGNGAAAVSRITSRTRGSAVREIALRLTITTSTQDGSAASARTTAAPTCPVPPMIKTRNAMSSLLGRLPLRFGRRLLGGGLLRLLLPSDRHQHLLLPGGSLPRFLDRLLRRPALCRSAADAPPERL